jgi:hypothetical protein
MNVPQQWCESSFTSIAVMSLVRPLTDRQGFRHRRSPSATSDGLIGKEISWTIPSRTRVYFAIFARLGSKDPLLQIGTEIRRIVLLALPHGAISMLRMQLHAAGNRF